MPDFESDIPQQIENLLDRLSDMLERSVVRAAWRNITSTSLPGLSSPRP